MISLRSDKSLYYKLNKDDIDYFTPLEQPEYIIPHTTSSTTTEPEPVAVLSLPQTPSGGISQDDVNSLLKGPVEEDDVINEDWFQKAIVVLDSPEPTSKAEIEGSALHLLKDKYGTTHIMIDSRITFDQNWSQTHSPAIHQINIDESSVPAAGPYLTQSMDGNLNLFPVYRLYPDTTSAHVTGVFPSCSGEGSYKSLDRTDTRKHHFIPVRSRLSCSGPRCSVKDVFDINGLVTGNGNRIYTELDEPAKSTAPAVQILIDAGVNIVAKSQTNEFAGAGPNVEQNTQFCYPWSYRMDRYQAVGGSSSGAASGISSFQWLDVAITTDTSGSTLSPAACMGLYGMRPTHGVIPMEGVLPSCQETDTPGIITRDPSWLTNIARTWLSNPSNVEDKVHSKLPKELIIPSDDLHDLTPQIKEKYQALIRQVSQTLGMPVKYINMSEAGPNPSTDEDMISTDEFKKLTFAERWRDFGKSLVEEYQTSNEGRWPPLGSYIANGLRDAKAENWPQSNFERYKRKLKKTGMKFNDLLDSDVSGTESESLFMNLWDPSKFPAYHEERIHGQPLTAPSKQPISPEFLPAYSGCPTIVAPFDQVPFESVVSGKTEQHPIAVSMMCSRGSDLRLAEIVDTLHSAGVLKTVKTGRTAF
ncbi:hypothetical protein I302_108165 [Kwoniella bestiolae CBS 10118]|uniref:Uncharacterized protein n=1 Tax=Kwoniella bestiolae CBS 10118 TaxID=1296100 RepID=A0A1B9FWG9_9TREE|nr:hypothetical protein I302_07469 [Kwoniella bestiolae CBS 10118]OCF23117.1 hypothetical protein I302_07469 [Kwoniella bestiolae CBS 10118]